MVYPAAWVGSCYQRGISAEVAPRRTGRVVSARAAANHPASSGRRPAQVVVRGPYWREIAALVQVPKAPLHLVDAASAKLLREQLQGDLLGIATAGMLMAHAGGLGKHRLVVINPGCRTWILGIRGFGWYGNTVLGRLRRCRTVAGRMLRRPLR